MEREPYQVVLVGFPDSPKYLANQLGTSYQLAVRVSFFVISLALSFVLVAYYFILLEPKAKEQTYVIVTHKTSMKSLPPDMNTLQKIFCSKMHPSFKYFQEVCGSTNPVTINYSPKPLTNDQLGLTPVAIISTDRAECLYRTLRALTSVEGVDPSLIVVFLDGTFKDPTYVSNFFNVKIQYNIIPTNGTVPTDWKEKIRYLKNRIDMHYKLSFDKLFLKLFPDARQAIILEDDLEVSPDFFSYFNQTINLLREDSSLYCISAWNDFSFQQSSRDPSLLYRVDTMPGLGWMLTRNLYEEIRPKWLNESESLAWDDWLRDPAQRKGRECIMPDVCRTFHFSKGVHINEVMQNRYFNTHSFNRMNKFHELQTKSLKKDAYEDLLIDLIKRASPGNHSLPICSNSIIPDTTNQTYVLYIQGYKTQRNGMRCFKIWSLNWKRGHKDSYRFWYKGNHVILIRCNESPYCKYKPEGLPFISK